MPRYTVALAPSGFVVVDGRSAGVIESGYHARYKAEQRCAELNAHDACFGETRPYDSTFQH